MKKTLLAIMMFACTAIAGNAQTLGVFIFDSNGPYTNVRNAPKGKVVDKIDTYGDFMLMVESPKNGWWRIKGGTYESPEGDQTKLKGSQTGYWIHNSVIGVGTRNYGGEKLYLRQSPNGKIVYSFNEEIFLRPLEIKGDWVKVKTADGKHIGWIEEEWLCGNSVTNCC